MKKRLTFIMALVMFITSFMTTPLVTKAAGKYSNIDLSIVSLRDDNGLPIGKGFVHPNGAFEVVCNDQNGYDWEISSSTNVSYWEHEAEESYDVKTGKVYTLHLSISPIDKDMCEDDVDINDVKKITFNGVQLSSKQYSRGELGLGIDITVKFYYANVSGGIGAGYYLQGETVKVIADSPKEGKHFAGWKGSYKAREGNIDIGFDNAFSTVTTFKMPGQSVNLIKAFYENHIPATINAIDSTCTSEGKTEYQKCSVCEEIITQPQTIPKKSHSFGENRPNCLICGEKNPNYIASKPKDEPLSPDEEILKTIKNGKITYELNSSKEYVGKKAKKSFVKKLKAGKRLFKITYSKVSGVTGYEVQYSITKKFTGKNAKKVKCKGNKKFTKKIKKLKASKKYYVRVRTYTCVEIKGKTYKLYSTWSKAKNIKTKK